jgi:hypothetical protein
MDRRCDVQAYMRTRIVDMDRRGGFGGGGTYGILGRGIGVHLFWPIFLTQTAFLI